MKRPTRSGRAPGTPASLLRDGIGELGLDATGALRAALLLPPGPVPGTPDASSGLYPPPLRPAAERLAAANADADGAAGPAAAATTWRRSVRPA